MSDSTDLVALLRLLEEALDRAPEERAVWLADLQRTEPRVAARVAELLAREEGLDRAGFMGELPTLPTAPAVPLSGLQLGPYTLERPLGRGGMGTVWLARRTDGRYEGKAAVKLLNLALLDGVGAARFRREGTVLARLSHANIARLLDAGLTETGQPYLVLEYIEGERIDVYCDLHRLPPRVRLQLFLQVLQGVNHAHTNLIVHRDLKPSNILVTPAGIVKLLDFGIAKLLEADSPAYEAHLTDIGWSALTPEYAAPEQVAGDVVTTATDVYALGIMLYVLLAGRHPTAAAKRASSEQLAVLVQGESTRLSAAVTADAAAVRGSTTDRLRRLYAGDLDTIVAKALRKDPAERYSTAAAFADDLQRHLRHEPVHARPLSIGYKAARFVRRHRGAVSVAATLAVLLAGGAWRERLLRHRAETEARKARAVGDYIVGVFDVADPFSVQRRDAGDLTVRTLLEQGARRVDSSLVSQPEVQAELRSVLGRAYTNLGLFPEATALLRRSLEQYRELRGESDIMVAETMDRLGKALVDQDKFEEAEPLLREALAQRRRLLGDVHEATAVSLDHLATLHQRRSAYDAAEPLFRDALAIRRALYGDTAVEVSESLNNLGVLLVDRGAYNEAEPAYREALAIDLKKLGENHPLTAARLHNLAQVQSRKGNVAEAEALYRRALAAKRATLGNAHPSVTVNLNNLGSLLLGQNRVTEAEPLIREALALDRQIFGTQHTYVAESLRNLGRVQRQMGRIEEAEQHYREALAINRSLHGAEHRLIATNLNDVGVLLRLKGDISGAVQNFREAVGLARRLLGENHINTLAFTINLGRALEAQGQAAEAESHLRRALAALDTTNGAHHPWYVNAQTGVGLVLVAQDRAAEASDLLKKAVARAQRELGEEHVRTADARLALGRALMANRRYVDAESALRSAATYFEPRRSLEPAFAAETARALAELGRRRREH